MHEALVEVEVEEMNEEEMEDVITVEKKDIGKIKFFLKKNFRRYLYFFFRARDCPDESARDKCFNCGRSGHLARECRER